MNNPQVENGYTKLANEIVDAFCKFRIRGESWQVLWVILRKTYGYNKKEDWISNSQIIEMTGLKKQNVWRELSELITCKIVIKIDDKLKLNKNYSEWIHLKKSSKVITEKESSKVITRVIKIDTKVINIDGHKRQYTKDNTTKEITTNVVREFGNSQINECRDYFLKVFELPDEDGSKKWNRIYWANLIRKSRSGVVGVKWLIDLAHEDEWFRNNITSAKQLSNNQMKIMNRRRSSVPKIAVMPKGEI